MKDCMYDYRFEYPKASTVDNCSYCGYEVPEGEEYWDFKGEIICKDCIDDYMEAHRKGEEDDD